MKITKLNKDLEQLSTSYRNLRATVFSKVHVVEQNIIILNRKTCINYDEYLLNIFAYLLYLYSIGLGYWTEQALESIHQGFNQFWRMTMLENTVQTI